jgi:hypothetical protein
MAAVAGVALVGCGGVARMSARSSAIAAAPPNCPATVARTLTGVASRAYQESAAGRVISASQVKLERSAALSLAVSRQDPAAVRAALRPLMRASIKRIVVTSSSGRVLANVGHGAALAPVHGTIAGPGGTPVGSFALSDTTASGFAKLVHGLTGAGVVMRSGGRMIAADRPHGATARTTTLNATAFPSAPVAIELRTPAAPAGLCGPTDAATAANTLGEVGRRLYRTEQGGGAVDAVLKLVSHNPAFARAVAADDPAALRAQIVRFFQEPALHVVRIRAVTSSGRLVNDVGGPYVLAPASAPVRLHGRKVGTVTLSIQDDTGYIKLMSGFTGAQVVLTQDGRVVPGSMTPQRGATAVKYVVGRFPSGPLHVALFRTD